MSKSDRWWYRCVAWLEDPRCSWCGQPTVLMDRKKGIPEPYEATLDHVYPQASYYRNSDRRGKYTQVLACYRCNQERGEFYEELQRRFYGRITG